MTLAKFPKHVMDCGVKGARMSRKGCQGLLSQTGWYPGNHKAREASTHTACCSNIARDCYMCQLHHVINSNKSFGVPFSNRKQFPVCVYLF